MTSGNPSRDLQTTAALGLLTFAILAFVFLAAPALAQSKKKTPPQTPPAPVGATVKGHVRDAKGNPSAYAVVSLDHATEVSGGGMPTPLTETQNIHTDSQGAYSFAGLSGGTYAVHARVSTGEKSASTSLSLAPNETKTVDLVIQAPPSSEQQSESASQSSVSQSSSNSSSANRPEFFDEPRFTVAGVTEASHSGGHGTDMTVRTSEALVKATGSLTGSEKGSDDGKESAGQNSASAMLEQQRKDLLAQIQHDENAHDEPMRTEQARHHHQLALIDEKLGNPLEAVQQYQRAAELEASEPNLFDWGSDLLTHRAHGPATEVFVEGHRLYPQSARILIGLSVAWYARGSYEQAARYLASASDLAPSDVTPYLFMGKMQSGEMVPPQEIVDSLARFAHLQPENALANYYYAVGLWKTKLAAGTLDAASSTKVEALLKKAVQLDPKLASAHLQLGILYAQRGENAHTIAACRKAIEVNPELEEAHYRLAQAYRRAGDDVEAQKELQLHEQLAKHSKEEAERKRREIQEFVISLRDTDSKPHLQP